MSEDKKEVESAATKTPAPDPEDEDLTKLLDNALGDFGKAKGEGSSEGEVPPPGLPIVDKELAQQAAQEFQNMLRQLAEVQKVVIEQNKQSKTTAAAGASSDGGGGLGPVASAVAAAGLSDVSASGAGGAGSDLPIPADGVPISPEEEAAFAENLLSNLQHLADKAKKVTDAQNEEDFLSAMEDMHKNESYTNEFLPFMQGLMSSLLSKDMMYPSLKEMVDKYPAWLQENGEKLEPSEKERYETQLGLMKEAVEEYEKENESDPEDVVAARFEKLIVVMQKMQLCGHPPEELVGQMPPGWSLGDNGLPTVTDSKVAADACSLM